MAVPRRLITTETRGVTSGTAFENNLTPPDISEAAISKIVIWHGGGAVNGLEVHYTGVQVIPVRHGGNAGSMAEIVLDPGELITTIDGGGNSNYITHLIFVTNKRVLGPYGSRTGVFFTWSVACIVPRDMAPRMGLLCFRGYADTYVRLLQATFAEYPVSKQPTAQVTYERGSEATAMVKADDEASKRPAALLSSFTVHIMSPIVTLLVGATKVEFHAYQDTLCRLPFFRAALTGEFKESKEKIIKMPEDEPAIVSTLLEYLYTGNYTYAYDPHETILAQDIVPTSDLAQGLFHIAVYTTAFKYDCSPLVRGAVANFFTVLKELDGMNVVRLWKAAYSKDLCMPKWGTDLELKGYKEGVTKLVTKLYQDHHDEMETLMSEYPVLALDLLRMTAGSKSTD